MKTRQKQFIYALWGGGVFCTFLIAIVAGGNLNPLQRIRGWEVGAPGAAPDKSPNSMTGQNEAMPDDYLRARDAFLGKVQNIFFATGCNVAGADSDAKSLVTQGQLVLHRQAASEGIDSDPHLSVMIEGAQRAGLDRAAQGCDYWQQNPDAALVLSRDAQFTASPP